MKFKNKTLYLGVLFFIMIACMFTYLVENDTSSTNAIWLILCIGGLLYYIFIEIVEFIKKIIRKIKIKEVRETRVKMEIIDKYFVKGGIKNITGTKVSATMPDSYIMKLKYKETDYKINDKDIFESYEVGEYVYLKLIEKLDKEQNIISYKLANIN